MLDPKASKKLFGEDRVMKIVYSNHTIKLLKEYLQAIKQDNKIIGINLQRYLRRHQEIDINTLNVEEQKDLDTLYQAILRSKEPIIFAENVTPEDKRFSAQESEILGYTACITEVNAYDNGAYPKSTSKIKIETYKETVKQFLIHVSAPILQKGYADYGKIVGENNAIVDENYYKQIKRILLPALVEQNAICADLGKKAIIAMPGLGCGCFAGDFNGALAPYLNKAIKRLLKEHGNELPNIYGIYLDTFNECEEEYEKINGIHYVVEPSGAQKSNTNGYIAPLATAEKRVEFFKKLDNKCTLEAKDLICVSIIAGDKLSEPGTDAVAGSKCTNEGVVGGATDLMGIHAFVKGAYDSSTNIYRSTSETEQGYGEHFVENRDLLLPLNDKTKVVYNFENKMLARTKVKSDLENTITISKASFNFKGQALAFNTYTGRIRFLSIKKDLYGSIYKDFPTKRSEIKYACKDIKEINEFEKLEHKVFDYMQKHYKALLLFPNCLNLFYKLLNKIDNALCSGSLECKKFKQEFNALKLQCTKKICDKLVKLDTQKKRETEYNYIIMINKEVVLKVTCAVFSYALSIIVDFLLYNKYNEIYGIDFPFATTTLSATVVACIIGKLCIDYCPKSMTSFFGLIKGDSEQTVEVTRVT